MTRKDEGSSCACTTLTGMGLLARLICWCLFVATPIGSPRRAYSFDTIFLVVAACNVLLQMTLLPSSPTDLCVMR